MKRLEFERLALEQLDAVFRLAFHLAHDVDEAEELVQEVFVRALRPTSVENFEPTGGGMRSWLFAICHNVFFTRADRKRRAASTGNDAIDAAGVEDLPPRELATAWSTGRIDWEQVDGTLKAAIHELRPEYREVLLMWGVEGLKYREIGSILGLPLGTVMSRLHRARAILTERLAAANLGKDGPNLASAARLAAFFLCAGFFFGWLP